MPRQCFNVDQSPLPFSIECKNTYEIPKIDKKVWVGHPHSGADKRFCSLNFCFRPDGEQPPLTIIFHGQGKHINDVDRKSWDKDVDVFFQPKAWADTAFNWVERTLKPVAKEESHFVLLCDNLKAQKADDFKRQFLRSRTLRGMGYQMQQTFGSPLMPVMLNN